MDHYILKDGEPVQTDLLTWGRWLEDNREQKVVKQEMVTVGLWPFRTSYWVSTVFLGLNHSWTPGGPPLIFETMVFKHVRYWKILGLLSYSKYFRSRWWKHDGKKHRLYRSFRDWLHMHERVEAFTDRYSTMLQAKDGHEAAVRDVRSRKIR